MASLPLNRDDFFPQDLAQSLHSQQSSSNPLYTEFETLLYLCSQADKVSAAAELLHSIKHHFLTSISSDYRNLLPYSFQTKEVSGPDNRSVTLQLLNFRSTYEPGAWSRTFYEGLSRYPAAEFYDRKVVELGCGNGWICLGLALRCMPELVVGVDINTRAILCAKLNLFLNGYNDRGELLLDSEGRSLIDRI